MEKTEKKLNCATVSDKTYKRVFLVIIFAFYLFEVCFWAADWQAALTTHLITIILAIVFWIISPYFLNGKSGK